MTDEGAHRLPLQASAFEGVSAFILDVLTHPFHYLPHCGNCDRNIHLAQLVEDVRQPRIGDKLLGKTPAYERRTVKPYHTPEEEARALLL